MRLPKLSGAADANRWRFHNKDAKTDDTVGMAIFAILTVESGRYKLVGTGFYITPAGHFVTAKHVAEELIDKGLEQARIINLLPGKQFILRAIETFDLHRTADIALGCPKAITDNKTRLPYRGKCVTISPHHPVEGTPITTWAHPLHKIVHSEEGTKVFLEPSFYDGKVGEFFQDRGPSGRLSPPYFLTDIHLHGGSSGGPVFDTTGRVFGVASSSYDGMENVSFVTPLSEALEIKLIYKDSEISFADFSKAAELF